MGGWGQDEVNLTWRTVGISVSAPYHDGLGGKVVSAATYFLRQKEKNPVRSPHKSLQQKNEVIYDPSMPIQGQLYLPLMSTGPTTPEFPS